MNIKIKNPSNMYNLSAKRQVLLRKNVEVGVSFCQPPTRHFHNCNN